MALFKTGQVVATPTALATCEKLAVSPATLLNRHTSGDWGDLDASDVIANIFAIQHDLRILSAYKVQNEKFYVITEADRSSTCLLLAEDY